MPVYEYECPECGTIYEATRRMEERNEPVKCVPCGVAATRIMSGFASKSGFYLRPPVESLHRKKAIDTKD